MHHHHLDRFAHLDSPVHRLDARAKLLAVLAYTVVLISFDRYAVAVLAPMAIGPAAMLWLAGVPLWFALRRAAILSPFVVTHRAAQPAGTTPRGTRWPSAPGRWRSPAAG